MPERASGTGFSGPAEKMRIQNGTVWRDTEGNVIHAHGGHILKHEGVYYWYGEDRRAGWYVSCYASKDLVSWEFRNHVLRTDSPVREGRVRADLSLTGRDGSKVNIERPKVLYNEKTGKFVMWMHYENGKDYRCAAAAVATCDTPDGDFVYHGSFNPYGMMSRDCTLFQDGEKAYFVSASRDNADMHIYLLQEDWLNVERLTANFWQGEYREAPALVKRDGRYYILSSFCTGWAPNQGRYACTDSLEQGFGMLRDIGDSTTYRSQPAFILTVEGEETTSYIYVGDRWDGKDYFNSRYVWFPLEFGDDGTVRMTACDELEIDAASGRIRPAVGDASLLRFDDPAVCRDLFEYMHPGFFEKPSTQTLPEGAVMEEMLLRLKDYDGGETAEGAGAAALPEGIRFGFYDGSMEKLRGAVEQVADGWLQYYTLKSRIFCAFDGDRIASFCILEDMGFWRGLFIGGPGCVGTVPEYRRRGIGLEMVRRATLILKEEGCDISYIHYTGVAHWYEKLGYRSVLRWNRKGFLKDLGV